MKDSIVFSHEKFGYIYAVIYPQDHQQLNIVAQLDAKLNVKQFYDVRGWSTIDGGPPLDNTLWEDQRPIAKAYQAHCRQRIIRALECTEHGLLIDAGSGPVQHDEFHEAHKRFSQTILLDLSKIALSLVTRAGRYHRVVGSMTELPIKNECVDAVMCVNAVNHVSADIQEQAVTELLRIAKPGAKLVFVSYNPDRIRLSRRRPSKRLSNNSDTPNENTSEPLARARQDLYFHAPQVRWWSRFTSQANVTLRPYRFLFVTDLHRLVPDDWKGRLVLASVSLLERVCPTFAARRGAYYLIEMRKR
ncbi:class I SAM-dependent methyltransferase [Bradyrhizobium barranii]|uniref:class I SAM-dependent methyltransferase n=1 Tax=Bradyrhizobium TaxID=374 RepID=UPI003F2537FC